MLPSTVPQATASPPGFKRKQVVSRESYGRFRETRRPRYNRPVRDPRPGEEETVATLANVGRRVLPRGWADLGRQLAIWFGFLFAYQAARGIADRNPPKAFDNGLKVIGFERHMHGLIELSFQRFVDSSQFLMNLASWTYWNSEFTVVALALLWVYLRRHEAFTRFRNAILLANVIGLVGYVLLPTAPPRMFPDFGFDDTLSQFASLNHGSGLVNFFAHPYAAMPSLHAARRDRPQTGRRLPRGPGATVRDVNRTAAIGSVKQGYTDGARRLASRYIGRLARTRVSPNALTAGGVLLCTAAAVAIPFEDRNKFLFYWLAAALFIVGSILDILDGALARPSDKATPFGEFLDSLSDRVSEGFVLTAIAFVFARARDDIAVIFCVAAVAGSYLVSYARAKAELIGPKGGVGIGSRAERVIVISSGLILAPLGVPLQWFIYLLAAAALLTVLQRILSVRKQLLRKEAHGFDQR